MTSALGPAFQYHPPQQDSPTPSLSLNSYTFSTPSYSPTHASHHDSAAPGIRFGSGGGAQLSYEQDATPERARMEAPRAYSLSGVPGFDGVEMSSMMEDDVPTEYSQLGRQVFEGGSVGRTIRTFSFSEYLAEPHGDESTGGQGYSQYRQGGSPDRSSPFPQFTTDPRLAHHLPLPSSPRLYQQPQQLSPYHSPQQHHSPHSPQQHQSHLSTPSTRVPYGRVDTRLSPSPYYSPYPTSTSSLMVRSISGRSQSSTSSGFSDASSYDSGSEYENGSCNPANITSSLYSAAAILSTSASASMITPSSGSGFFGTYISAKSASASDISTMRGLKLDDEQEVGVGVGLGLDMGGEGGGTISGRTKRTTTKVSAPDSTIRASPRNATRTRFAPPRRATSRGTYFDPDSPELDEDMEGPASSSPISLPGRARRGFPTDAEIPNLITKSSRGRRPPSSPALLGEAIEAGVDPNLNPSAAQIEYCGVTKTGRPKKIFLCKVPDCGKCFKRSEHLKRHVRSIHTNEKPFECKWTSCGKFFSRQDNLNQHVRIHRGTNQSETAFTKQLESCFGRTIDRLGRLGGAIQSDNESDDE